MRSTILRLLPSVVITCSLFAFAMPAAAQPAPSNPTQEQIQTFVSRITVNPDGTIGVNEQVGYFFPSPRRGIDRVIPLRYVVGGKTVEMTVTDVQVRYGDATPVHFTAQRTQGSLRITIGDPNVTVQGLRNYDIAYTVSGALRYSADHDELYWNVTGGDWQVPIGNVSASVVPPAAAPRNRITTTCFAGPSGGTVSGCMTPPAVGASADFAASRGPLTVVVGWPHGLVAVLLPKTVSPWENPAPYAFLAAALALIVALSVRWRAKNIARRVPTSVSRLPLKNR